MEKKQYLDARLRRDFIRYVILRTPEFDNKEISRRLNKDIAADYLYQRLKERMNRILDRHLGECMIKDEKRRNRRCPPRRAVAGCRGRYRG